MSEFKWDDNMVRDILGFCIGYEQADKIVTEFKQSRQKLNQDWEILSFVNTKNGDDGYTFNFIYPKVEDGKFQVGFNVYSEQECLAQSDVKIHSVKVLSSGEIFSVGDITGGGNKILSFMIIDGKYMEARLKSYPLGYSTSVLDEFTTNIQSLTKQIKQPLFTTEQQSEIKSIKK